VPLLRSSVLVLLAAVFAAPGAPSHADPAPPTCNASVATIVGTDGDDDLTGTDGRDVVWLGAGDDIFHGLGGLDQVCPGPGKNQIDTGPGDDYVYGESNWDQNVIRTGKGNDSVLNSGGQIFTGPGRDVTDSLFGDATIHTGPGPDNVEVAGHAHVWLGPGADVAHILYGSPVVEGDGGADLFYLWTEFAPEDEDTSYSGAQLLGGDGRDSLHWAMAWPMRLDVRAGRVTSHGDILGNTTENNTEATFRRVERFVGGSKDDVMIGHSGRDLLDGGVGDDTMRGLGGGDALYGNQGDDLLIGGAGIDVAHGGRGVDTCRTERRHRCERR
jgi:Ca2+-binding RTX toxin-like protein